MKKRKPQKRLLRRRYNPDPFTRMYLFPGNFVLSGVSAKNFKSIKSIDDIPLKKINLIYGQNSIGKSSLLQSLLVNRENISDLSYISDGFEKLRFSGKTFDVGGFKHMTHKNNENNIIELGNTFTSKTDGEVKFSVLFKKGNFFGINIIFKNTVLSSDRDHKRIGWEDETNASKMTVNGEIKFKLTNNKNHIEFKKLIKGHSSLWDKRKYLVAQNPSLNIITQNQTKKIKNTKFESILIPANIGLRRFGLEVYGKTTQGQWKRSNSNSVFSLRGEFKNLKEDETLSLISQAITGAQELYESTELVHIPPIRGIPGRALIDMSSMNIDPSISYVFSLFNPSKFSTRQMNFSMMRRRAARSRPVNSAQIINDINKSLSSLSMNYEVSTQDGSNLGREGENLVLKAKNLDQALAFSDVGKGISQVLPILAAVHGERRKTILIEQPEIHLHPKLQADLADVFIESKDTNQNKYLIETHSENLLLRIQSKVRNQKLDPEDVQIIYLDKDTDESIKPVVISLDGHGRLDKDFPDGFLEIGLNEVLS